MLGRSAVGGLDDEEEEREDQKCFRSGQCYGLGLHREGEIRSVVVAGVRGRGVEAECVLHAVVEKLGF